MLALALREDADERHVTRSVRKMNLSKIHHEKPDEYWKDTSDNAIIRSFIDYAGASLFF